VQNLPRTRGENKRVPASSRYGLNCGFGAVIVNRAAPIHSQLTDFTPTIDRISIIGESINGAAKID
jgi:hypothetical protein